MSNSKASSHGLKHAADGDPENETPSGTNDPSIPDASVKHGDFKRILKEVGLTSTTFIGPAFPPNKVQSDIEDTLSEFYKELEKIDTPNGADNNSGKRDVGFVQPGITPQTSSSQEITDGNRRKIFKSSKMDSYQQSSRQKPLSSKNYDQNELHYPRRPKPFMDPLSGSADSNQNQWHYPQTENGPRPPNPRFRRQPFLHPPSSSAFPYPQNPASHMNRSWDGSGMTQQYQEKAHFPPYHGTPTQNFGGHLSQDPYGDSPHYLKRDQRGYDVDVNSDNVNVGWSQYREEEWCQFGGSYDQRYDAEHDSWDHYYRPPDNNYAYHPSLVLILMRGLPGSGKSTRARYVSVVQFKDFKIPFPSLGVSFSLSICAPSYLQGAGFHWSQWANTEHR